jgi:hypothetical protein
MEIKKGRPAKNIKKSLLIKDELIEPFYIEKDDHNFIVFEKTIPTRGYGSIIKPDMDKRSLKRIGYFSSLNSALEKIVKCKFSLDSQQEYSTIKEYIVDYRNIEKNIKFLINKIQ